MVDGTRTKVFAGRTTDFVGDQRAVVLVDGREVVVLNHQGEYHAVLNLCPHMGGPVGEGMIIGKVEAVVGENKELLGERFSDEIFHLVCPWHGWEYDLRSGECAGDRSICLRKYNVEVDGDSVYVIA